MFTADKQGRTHDNRDARARHGARLGGLHNLSCHDPAPTVGDRPCHRQRRRDIFLGLCCYAGLVVGIWAVYRLLERSLR